jgi:hypothetical protein
LHAENEGLRPSVFGTTIKVEGIQMGISLVSVSLLFAVVLCASPQSPGGTPIMSSVEPGFAKVGEVLVAKGVNLDAANVAELYLTDGKNDLKVAMIEQTATTIRFKVPPEAKPGRYSLMVLTKGITPRLVEQPVKLDVVPETSSLRLHHQM